MRKVRIASTAHQPSTAAATQRAIVLTTAYIAHPERFVRRPPTPAPLPSAVWINPPKRLSASEDAIQ